MTAANTWALYCKLIVRNDQLQLAKKITHWWSACTHLLRPVLAVKRPVFAVKLIHLSHAIGFRFSSLVSRFARCIEFIYKISLDWWRTISSFIICSELKKEKIRVTKGKRRKRMLTYGAPYRRAGYLSRLTASNECPNCPRLRAKRGLCFFCQSCFFLLGIFSALLHFLCP